MAARAVERQNRGMETETNSAPEEKHGRRKQPRIVEMEAQIDERDETIRLLNEALSRALDELNMLDRAA
jgi:hypothetical protein